MKKLLVVFLALSIVLPLASQTPDKTEYFANGSMKAEYFADGDNLVKVRFYFASGQLRETGQFLNAERHGEWISYNRSGNISATGHFDAGEKSGVWKFWDNEGNLSQEVDYSGEKPQLVVHAKEEE